MQTTPRGNRLHIALFGRRNVGKSSIINAITGQDIALVSPVPGTTTDPVFKAMEIPPLGPVVLIDTAGLDDEGSLGELRVKRSRRVLQQADMVLLVLEAGSALTAQERELLELVRKKAACGAAVNKIDKQNFHLGKPIKRTDIIAVPVSALTEQGLPPKNCFNPLAPKAWDDRPLARFAGTR